MSGILKFDHYPELFTSDSPTNIVCHIIIYLVVCHSTDNNVKVMLLSGPACYYEIKPIVCQFLKFKDTQILVLGVLININPWRIELPCPTLSLLFQYRAIKTRTEVFCILPLYDLGLFNLCIASVI